MPWNVRAVAGTVAVVLGGLATGAAHASADPLEGRVVENLGGGPVAGIQVYLQSRSAPGIFFVQPSGADGRFVFANPPPGLYTIRAVVGGTPWKGFTGYLVPPGVPDGQISGPIGLPLGMSSDVELRLSGADSGGGGTPPPPFDGLLQVLVRRAVGRLDAPADIFSFNLPLGWEDVAGQRVRVTRVEPTAGAPFERLTDASGYVSEPGIAPPGAFDEPPLTYAFDVAMVDGNGVAGPATRLTDTAPGWFGRANLLAPPRLASVTGRVFAEPVAADGVFDAADWPLPGRVVRLFAGPDVLPPAVPVATAVTDDEGRYAFDRVVDGLYVLEVDGRAGPERRATDFVLLTDGAGPVVDFALTSDTCPRVACGDGPLHEALLEAEVAVGDPTSFTLSATLHDGCDTAALRDALSTAWSGPFPGPVTGANGVLRVESVAVTDGLARVRLRATAQGTPFPGGFFGTPTRRVAVTLNGRVAGTCVPLACGSLPTGVVLPALSGVRRGASGPVRAIETWTYDAWRRCTLAGPCPAQSATPDGGTNAIELETTLFGPTGRGPVRILHVGVRCGRSSLDRASVAFAGETWSGVATGPGGTLTVLGVRRSGPRLWTVRLRLAAPERLDGHPGALPGHVATITARLGTAGGELALSLAAPPPPGPLYGRRGVRVGTVLTWTSAVDAACD